jgi:predicted  nucleic acid-binding Zn-ribbon protein
LIQEKLHNLTTLQKMDLELDEIDKSIREEQAVLEKRVAALAAREEQIAATEEKIEAQKRESRILEGEMSDKMEHIRERQTKMMQVQTGREQTALLKEIEDAKKVAKESEEKIISLMESVEKMTGDIAEEKNLLKGEKKLVTEETEAVRSKIDSINRKRRAKDKAREAQASLLDADTLKKYNTLRARRNGLAIINVVGGVCQGCYMMMPPQRFNMLMKGDQLFECPTCQRMIYYKPVVED